MSVLNLTKTQRRNYGVFSKAKSFESTIYSDLFKRNQIAPTTKEEIEFDIQVGETKVASLKKRGAVGVTILDDTWIRVKVKPGLISANVPLSADDFNKMMAGEVEVLLGGEMIKTPAAMVSQGIERLRGAVDRRFEIMCSESITNGQVVSSDATVVWDYKLPAIKNVSWNTSGTTGIVKIVSDIIREGKKVMGMIPPKIEIGSDIVDRMLADDLFLKQSQALNTGSRTNIANSSVDEQALFVGQVLGRILEEMEMSFDAKGVDITPGDQIRLLDTSAFRTAYAGIDIKDPTTGTPAMVAADAFVGIDEGTESQPNAKLFVKSYPFPVITKLNAVLRYKVTIS